MIEEYGIDYSCIAVEILEDKDLDDEQMAVMTANLIRLKEKGVLIFLDDFGKGYAGFRDLTEFHMNQIRLLYQTVLNILL